MGIQYKPSRKRQISRLIILLVAWVAIFSWFQYDASHIRQQIADSELRPFTITYINCEAHYVRVGLSSEERIVYLNSTDCDGLTEGGQINLYYNTEDDLLLQADDADMSQMIAYLALLGLVATLIPWTRMKERIRRQRDH